MLYAWMFGEIIERRATVFVKMRNRGPGGIFQPASAPAIVKRDGCARRLDPVIDLGGRGN